jgi:hypothetical protein
MGFFSKLFGTVDRQQKPAADNELLRMVRRSRERETRQAVGRLDDRDEIIAQRLTKLLYSISFNDGRNQRAYESASREMQQIGTTIMSDGGQERWRRIRGRVEILCDTNLIGFAAYLEHTGL